jgi:hypothetical protein
MLDQLEQAILTVVDRLTRETHADTHADAIRPQLAGMGLEVPDELLLGRVLSLCNSETQGIWRATSWPAGGQCRWN